jgi:hypothetical protein
MSLKMAETYESVTFAWKPCAGLPYRSGGADGRKGASEACFERRRGTYSSLSSLHSRVFGRGPASVPSLVRSRRYPDVILLGANADSLATCLLLNDKSL